MIDTSKIVSRVTYNSNNISLDLSGLRKEIIEGEWTYAHSDGVSETIYTLYGDGTGVINTFINKKYEGIERQVTYTNTDARLWITYDDGSIREFVYVFKDNKCTLTCEGEVHLLVKKTVTRKIGTKEINENMKTFYAKDDGLDGYSEFTVQIKLEGTITDADAIKYEDQMDNFRTGKPIPTDDEYNQIFIEGYEILDRLLGVEE